MKSSPFRPVSPCPGPVYYLSRLSFHIWFTPESSTLPFSPILSLVPSRDPVGLNFTTGYLWLSPSQSINISCIQQQTLFIPTPARTLNAWATQLLHFLCHLHVPLDRPCWLSWIRHHSRFWFYQNPELLLCKRPSYEDGKTRYRWEKVLTTAYLTECSHLECLRSARN